MSWKRTIIAGLAFAACLLLLVLDRQLVRRGILQRVEETSLAPGINLSEVTEARLKNRQGETLLVREQGRWFVKEPYRASADPEIVEQMIINVTAARRNNEIEAKNLAEYGLAAPEASLALRTEKGKSFELQVGNESTYTGQVFAKYPAGSRVFTVGEHVRSVMLRSPRDWRRARLLDVDIGNLDAYDSYSVTGGQKTMTLRHERGRWVIVSPVQAAAETDVVNDFLRKLGLLRATQFLSEKSDRPTSMAAALQALATPAAVVTLEKQRTPPAKVVIGKVAVDDSTVYVAQRAGEPEVMVIDAGTFGDLTQDENFFRSRTIFSVKPADVGQFSIEIGRLKTELVRNEQGRWEFKGEPKRRVDQEQVNVRLESLLRMRVRDFADIAPQDPGSYGLLPPQFKFSVISKDKSVTEGLEVGKKESGHVGSVFARRQGDTAVFAMDLSPDLIIAPESVADRKFARSDTERVTRVEIESGGQKYELKRERNEWSIQRPGQTAFTTLNSTRIARVMAILNELEFTKDHTAEGETVIAPVESPDLAIRFYLPGGDKVLDLSTGRKLSATTYVTTGDDQTYDVRNNDVEALKAAVLSLLQ